MSKYLSNRNNISNYFPLPNKVFSLGLCSGEIAVYAYLMFCEDRKTYQCHPSYKTIGQAIGVSKNTVKKYVDKLVDKQLITTAPTSVITSKGEKRNGNLRYTILPVQKAVDYFHERQLRELDTQLLCQRAKRIAEDYDQKKRQISSF